MVSLNALIDSFGMLFDAKVYHWWVIHDYGVHPNTHTYDFGLWWGLLGDTTSIFMVQNLYVVYSSLTHVKESILLLWCHPFYTLDHIFIEVRLC
jgi:hypothetical protein